MRLAIHSESEGSHLNEIVALLMAVNLFIFPLEIGAQQEYSEPKDQPITTGLHTIAPQYTTNLEVYKDESDSDVTKISAVTEASEEKADIAEQRKLLGTYKLTAYCPCKKCTGKSPSHKAYKITASGATAVEGITVAMKGIEFGTRIYIEGVGERIVQDRGVGENVIDIYCELHNDCFDSKYNQKAQVWVIE